MDIQKSFLLDKSNFILYFLLLFIVGSTLFFYIRGQSNPISDAVNRNKVINTLFVVYNEADETWVSTLYFYDPQTKRGALMDIPSNTGYVFTSLKKVDRIDTVFNPKNPTAYLVAVKNLLSLEELPFYMFFNLKQFAELVDLVGGVEIFNVSPIFSQEGDEVISLPSGSILLDGDLAIQLLKLDKNNNLSQKIAERRQKFMLALIRKLSRSFYLVTNRYVKGYLEDLITTNIDTAGLKTFWLEMSSSDPDGFILQYISGSTRRLDDQVLLFPHYEGHLIKDMVSQTLTSLKNTERVLVDLWPNKVEIQNGTSRNGLASNTQRIYESMGFTVSKLSNTDQEVNYTMIIDISGNIEVAQKVADIIKATRIYSIPQIDESSSESVADVQVILGKDFDGRYVQQVNIEGE